MARLSRTEIFDPTEIVAVHTMARTIRRVVTFWETIVCLAVRPTFVAFDQNDSRPIVAPSFSPNAGLLEREEYSQTQFSFKVDSQYRHWCKIGMRLK